MRPAKVAGLIRKYKTDDLSVCPSDQKTPNIGLSRPLAKCRVDRIWFASLSFSGEGECRKGHPLDSLDEECTIGLMQRKRAGRVCDTLAAGIAQSADSR
jgi:hypothetical protein